MKEVLGSGNKATDRESNEPEATISKTKSEGRHADTVVATLQSQVDSTRRLGNLEMYSFYAKAAGWDTLVLFSFAMATFAFFTSFPSKRPNHASWLVTDDLQASG